MSKNKQVSFCSPEAIENLDKNNHYQVEYRDPRHILIETNIPDMLKKVAPNLLKNIKPFHYDFSSFPLSKPPLEKSYFTNYQKIQRSDYLKKYFQRLSAEKQGK